MSNDELLAEVGRLAACERQATADLIASLAELDRRRLYLGAGYSSLFAYCTRVLHLSEHAAYGRIEAARAATRFPAILAMLAHGSLTLTAVCLLAPHLTDENHEAVLRAARLKSKREVEHLVVELRPLPDAPAVVRKLPTTAAHAGSSTTLLDQPTFPTVPPPVRSRPVVAPLAPQRYKIQFTVGEETHEKLQRAMALMRHRLPNGDLAQLFDRALTLLIVDLERTKCGLTHRPRLGNPTRNNSRHIPAAVRSAVWKRDDGQCAFIGTDGRCSERSFLEYHHIKPFAAGGRSLVENICLRCRAHNRYEAERYFGPGSLFVRESPSPEYVCSKNSVRTEFTRMAAREIGSVPGRRTCSEPRPCHR